MTPRHVRIGLEVEALVPAGVFTERDLPGLQARLVEVMRAELVRAVEERSAGSQGQGQRHEDEDAQPGDDQLPPAPGGHSAGGVP